MDDIFLTIARTIANLVCCEVSNIKPTTRFKDDLEFDSVDAIELYMEIEDIYNVEIDDQQHGIYGIGNIKTVGELVDYIKELLNGR